MSAIAFRTWLSAGQDYRTGVALLGAHPGARPAVLSLLKRSKDGAFTRSKLVEEISRLADVIVNVIENVSVTPAVTSPTAGAVETDEVAALVKERTNGFRQAAHLHGQLRLLATNAERATALAEIKRLFARNEEIWDALHYRDRYGVLPAAVPATAAASDPAALTTRRNTLRTYLSSKRGTAEKRLAWAAELAALERSLVQ